MENSITCENEDDKDDDDGSPMRRSIIVHAHSELLTGGTLGGIAVVTVAPHSRT